MTETSDIDTIQTKEEYNLPDNLFLPRFLLLISFLIFTLFDVHIESLLHLGDFFAAEIMLAIFMLYLVLQAFATRKMKQLPFLIFLFLIYTIIVGFFKNGIAVSVIGTFFLFKSLIAFLCGYAISPSKREIYKIFNIILGIACISGFVTILQYFTHNSFINNPFGFSIVKSSLESRGKGIFSHPNKNGQVLLLGAILCFYCFKNTGEKWKIYACLSIIAGGMIGSGSRQSLLGFVVILCIHYLVINKASKKIASFFSLSVVLGFFAFFFGGDYLGERFGSVGNSLETGDYFRLQAVMNSFEILEDYPVFGVGPGLYGGTIAEKYGSPYYEKYDTFAGFMRKESLDLDTYWPHAWAELGIAGFILYLLIIYMILIRLFRLRKTVGDIPKILLLMLISIMFVSIFSLEIEAAFINLTAFLLAGSVLHKPNKYLDETT